MVLYTNHSTLPDGRHVYTNKHSIGTVSGLVCTTLMKDYNIYLTNITVLQDKHEHSEELEGSRTNMVPYSASGTIGEIGVTLGNKIDWGFNASDNWNMQN